MKKIKIGCLSFVIFLILCGIIGVISSNKMINDDNCIIFDTSSVSKISSSELISKLGEPENKDSWKFETSKGIFDFITYTYTIEDVLYEFILADDQVVRLTLTSNSETPFKYSHNNKEDTLTLFNVFPEDYAKKTADTGYAFRVSPVNNAVTDFWVLDINEKQKTFDMVKITYNSNYFE